MADSKMSRMTRAFKDEFRANLARNGRPPNQHFEDLVKILKKHHMCYLITAHPSDFLTHKKNRGGLLLSPHNAHKNAAGIKATGADLTALSNSWATELPVDGQLREEQLAKNLQLIERAEGLLAEVNGKERFCSVGCGHTVAFCKHVDAGGHTPLKSLQREGSTLIDVQGLFQNENFKTMVTQGWEWHIVYAEVDINFPEFAQIAQRALNTRNHVANVMGELEVCMTLTETMKDPGMKVLPDWKQLAVDNIESLCAPCAHYAGTLLEYIVAYGGGDDACLIQFIDNVAKQHRANMSLGQTMWKTLFETEFFDKQRKYPMVRTALVIANLTGPDVQDSVARLVSKGDVARAASKAKMADTLQAEIIMDDAWKLTTAVCGIEEGLKPLGQLFARMGLKVTGLEKKGREGKSYTFLEMKKQFLKGISEIVGKSVEFPKWFGDDEDTKEPSTEPVQAVHVPKMATMEDHSDPTWICLQKGFKVGSTVTEKGIDINGESYYVIFTIGAYVRLHQACSFSGNPRKVAISVEELLKNWSLTKVEPTRLMQAPEIGVPDSLQKVLKKNEIYSTILELYTKHKKHLDALAYFKGPDHVRSTNSTIKAGSLVLVPAVPITNIACDCNTARGIDLGEIDEHTYTIIALSKPQHKGDAWDPPDAFVNPYFWVGKTEDKKLANMVPEEIEIKGLSIPVLRNSVDIPPHSKLCLYSKPKAVMAPLQNAQKDDEDDDDDNDDTAKPKAKAKAKGKAKAKAKGKAPTAPTAGAAKRARKM